jgi:hypothetical protein
LGGVPSEEMQTAILTVLAVLLAAAGTASAAPVPGDHSCMGPWVGRGQNSGYTTYWTIDLSLTASPHGGRCGTIQYRNPDCGGFLEECRLVGQDIHTREVYTERGSCAPPGEVVIRCEGDSMRYSWRGWETVNTTLRRPQGYQTPSPAPGPSPSSGPSPSPSPTPGPAPSPSPGPSPGPSPSPGPGPSPGPSPSPNPSPPADSGGCAVVAPGGIGVGAPVALALVIAGGRKRRRPTS